MPIDEPVRHPSGISFHGGLHRSVQDGREGEVTLTLKVPASDAALVTLAFQLLIQTPLIITLSTEDERLSPQGEANLERA